MPEVITCPECAGQLRIKEEMLGKKIKCPKCQKQFVARLEEEVAEPEEIEEEEKAPTRSVARKRHEEDEEDRPRKRRRDEEDEEDDRPRKRRRDEEDEDAEMEDRPRKRRRDEEEEDEEDEERRPKKKSDPRKEASWLRLAVLLLLIGVGAAGGTMLLRFLLDSLTFLGGVRVASWVKMLLVGIPGLAGVLTFTVGAVFCLFGPRGRGSLAFGIALLSVTGVNLLLLLVGLIPRDMEVSFGQRLSMPIDWERQSTALPLFTILGTSMIAGADFGMFGFDTLLIITGLLEVSRMILTAFWVRSVSQSTNKKSIGNFWLVSVIVSGSGPVVMMILGLIFGGIMKSMSITSRGTATTMMFLILLLTTLVVVAIFTILGMLLLRLRSAALRSK